MILQVWPILDLKVSSYLWLWVVIFGFTTPIPSIAIEKLSVALKLVAFHNKADMGDYRAISVLIDMLGDKEFSEGSSYLWYPSKINLTPEKVVFQSLNQHFSGPKDWFYLQSRYFFTENQCL